MFSTKTLSLLTLVALSGLTSAYDEVTTTSTEIVYVTITQTSFTGTDDSYTVLVTPSVDVPTDTDVPTVTDDSESTYSTPTIEVEEAPYPTETDVVEVPLNGTTSTLAPSGGYSTTLRLNETVYTTSDPSLPAPTEDEYSAAVMGVQVGMKSLLALAGMVGAGMFML